MKTKILFSAILFVCISCKQNTKQNLSKTKDVKQFLENKAWVPEKALDTMYISNLKYYVNGRIYLRNPEKDTLRKGSEIIENFKKKVPEQGIWVNWNNYKISGDTLITKYLDDEFFTDRVRMMDELKMMKDTVIGAITYHKIEMTKIWMHTECKKKTFHIPEEERESRYMVSKKIASN